MSDDNQTTQASSTDQGVAGQSTTNQSAIVVPEEVRQKFPDLVEMILASVSMDDDERKYWFSVLPVMTEPQIAELRDILESEKKKLQEIDAKYSKPEEVNLSTDDIKKIDEERDQKRQQRIEAEKKSDEEAAQEADALLGELDNL